MGWLLDGAARLRMHLQPRWPKTDAAKRVNVRHVSVLVPAADILVWRIKKAAAAAAPSKDAQQQVQQQEEQRPEGG